MAVEYAGDIQSKRGAQFKVYVVRGNSDYQDKELFPGFTTENLHDGLYRLGYIWGGLKDEIKLRFSCGRLAELQNTNDFAYVTVDPENREVASDVLVFSDCRYPKLGLHTLVHTQEKYEGQGLCKKLMALSVANWFDNNGEMMILHTESDIAYNIYSSEEVGYLDWYGKAPKTHNFSEAGVMMLNTRKRREVSDVVASHFDGSGELMVEPLLRADAAQFVLFASAYQSCFGYPSGRDNEPIHVPALDNRDHWISDGRFMQQFLFGDDKDILLALKTVEEGKLVGVGTWTYHNDILRRTGISEAVFVHPNYCRGESLLKKAMTEARNKLK